MRVLTFLFILLIVNVHGQSYIHFPTTHGVWHETYIDTPPPNYFFTWYNSIGETYYDGDTTINNLNYHKLYRNIRDIFCSQVFIYQHGLIGAIREDTSLHRIYQWDPIENSEQLLYDFNLEAGDTVYYPINAIVDKIDTIITNDGISRRRWNCYGPFGRGAIIEGIGSTNGVLSNMIGVEYQDVTMCFEGDDSLSVYINESYGYGYGECRVPTDSCYNTSLIEQNIQSIEIFPNPLRVGTTMHIKVHKNLEKSIISSELIDFQGRVYEAGKINNTLYISVPSNPGFYLLMIKTNKNQSIYKKIIVTN